MDDTAPAPPTPLGPFDALRWAWATTAGGPGPKATLVAVANYADEAGTCFPGQALLARQTEQGVRTVRRHLADFEARGLLCRRTRSRTEGRGRTSDRYRLHVAGVCPWCDQPATVAGNSGERPSETPHDQPAIHDTKATTNRPPTTDQPATVAREVLENCQTTDELPASRAKPPADGFELFWTAYPRKVAKAAALKAWPRAVKAAGGNVAPIVAGAWRLADDPNREEAFTPHPATWLNAERWNDPPLPDRAAAEAARRRTGAGAVTADTARTWLAQAEAQRRAVGAYDPNTPELEERRP